MLKIVSNKEMQELDRYTIEKLQIPGLILMENAGLKTAMIIENYMQDIESAGPLHIFCGKGNNGGDGYVIARYFFDSDYEVYIYAIGDPEDLKGDAFTNYNACKHLQVPLYIIESASDLENMELSGIVVDALLGTGIKGAVRGIMKDIIHFINAQELPVIAVDIPSGLNGDRCDLPGESIRAEITATMALPQRAHIFYPAKKQVGQLEIVKIGIPDDIPLADKIKLNLIEDMDIVLPNIEADAHKYKSGKLLILAGSAGMTGAAYLSAQAALLSGVGLVYLGIPRTLNDIMENKLTEALTLPLPETACHSLAHEAVPKVKEKIDWADAVVLGPGIGRNDETIELIQKTITFCSELNKPTLLDADALFALAEKPLLVNELSSNFVVTPHHGEFLRFLNLDKNKLSVEPWKYAADFIKDKNYCLNLKGTPSMVALPNGQMYVNSTGNQCLAKGGSGDVLSGITGGLLARGLDPAYAAIAGNYIHGYAADMAAADIGITSCLPTDLFKYLSVVFDFTEE